MLSIASESKPQKHSSWSYDACKIKLIWIENTKLILEQAILNGGTTIRSYESSEGVHGRFQENLLVHNQVGKKCKNCNSEILKIKVNGRGTYYCPKCQK